MQLAANYWTFLYLVWVRPLLCLSLLESRNLSTADVPAAPAAAAVPGPPLPPSELTPA